MIKYLFLDIDGTFTDGGIYYDDNNNEIKKFCTKDGTGIICAHVAGIELIVLTGRECNATMRRMSELHIDRIEQGVKDKVAWIRSWIDENKIDISQIGYIGDDVNDLGSMRLCGWIGCPSDAAVEVRCIADYVSVATGGHGAVRECIEKILRDEGLWEEVLEKAYHCSGI